MIADARAGVRGWRGWHRQLAVRGRADAWKNGMTAAPRSFRYLLWASDEGEEGNVEAGRRIGNGSNKRFCWCLRALMRASVTPTVGCIGGLPVSVASWPTTRRPNVDSAKSKPMGEGSRARRERSAVIRHRHVSPGRGLGYGVPGRRGRAGAGDQQQHYGVHAYHHHHYHHQRTHARTWSRVQGVTKSRSQIRMVDPCWWLVGTPDPSKDMGVPEDTREPECDYHRPPPPFTGDPSTGHARVRLLS